MVALKIRMVQIFQTRHQPNIINSTRDVSRAEEKVKCLASDVPMCLRKHKVFCHFLPFPSFLQKYPPFAVFLRFLHSVSDLICRNFRIFLSFTATFGEKVPGKQKVPNIPGSTFFFSPGCFPRLMSTLFYLSLSISIFICLVFVCLF